MHGELNHLYQTAAQSLSRVIAHESRRNSRGSQSHLDDVSPTEYIPKINRKGYGSITIYGDTDQILPKENNISIGEVVQIAQKISRIQAGYLTHLLLNHLRINDDTDTARDFFKTYSRLFIPHFTVFTCPAISLFKQLARKNHVDDSCSLPKYTETLSERDTLLVYERPLLFTDSSASSQITESLESLYQLSNDALWEIRRKTLGELHRLITKYRESENILLIRVNPPHIHSKGVYYCFKVTTTDH